MDFNIDQKEYDRVRKLVCDDKGNHKPNHCSTVIICLLEKVLEKLSKGSFCDDKETDSPSEVTSQTSAATSGISQSGGGMNINTGGTSADSSNSASDAAAAKAKKSK